MKQLNYKLSWPTWNFANLFWQIYVYPFYRCFWQTLISKFLSIKLLNALETIKSFHEISCCSSIQLFLKSLINDSKLLTYICVSNMKSQLSKCIPRFVYVTWKEEAGGFLAPGKHHFYMNNFFQLDIFC